jgi:hypothetical protein
MTSRSAIAAGRRRMDDRMRSAGDDDFSGRYTAIDSTRFILVW